MASSARATNVGLAGESGPGLRKNALGRGEVIYNNIAECAPAIATCFVMGLIVTVAGVGTPLVVLIAGLAFFLHAHVNAVFAKHIPSAGFYSTYSSRTWGPEVGSIVAGAYLVGIFLFFIGTCFQVGVWVSTAVATLFSFNLYWWIPALVIWAMNTIFLLLGVKISVRAAIVMFSFEITILIIGMIAMLVHNSGFISGAGFNPANIKGGLTGFGLGFPLAIFLLLGVTGSSALAEETREPRRHLPPAIRIATLAGIAIYVAMAWGQGIGFRNNSSLLAKTVFPFLVGSNNALGGLKYVMYIAGFTSACAVMLAVGNAACHVLYNVSRERLTPRLFTATHFKRQSPWMAILIPNCVLMAICLILGGFIGGPHGFTYTVTLATDVLVVIFMWTNVSLMVWSWRNLRPKGEFSWWSHWAIPAVGVVALGYPLYRAVKPGQASPYDWFGVLVIAAYVLSFIYVVLRRRAVSLRMVGSRLAHEDEHAPAGAEPALAGGTTA